MAGKVIPIPTLNDGPRDFDRLFSIWKQVNNDFEDVCFDFSKCRFLRPNAVAFLGGLARLIEYRAGIVVFDWDTFRNSAVMVNICQNGFAGNFGYHASGWDGNSIPYRETTFLDMNGIMDYLTYNWIGKGWVNVSERLRDAIAGRMWEIYNNAFEHSGTKIGVFSCGQYFKTSNELVLSVVDFGQGIPNKIRAFLRHQTGEDRASKLAGAYCLKWAFTSGYSTCIDGVARGLGLDLLKEFIRVNQGKMEVYSNDGYAIIDRDGDRYFNTGFVFDGTIMHITLRRDERFYIFQDETKRA
jgi:hypothetical protein